MSSKIIIIKKVIKDFFKDLKKSFMMKHLDVFDVFIERPRLIIWLVSSYMFMFLTIKGQNINLIVTLLSLLISAATYLVLIAFVSSEIIEGTLRYANGVRRVATSKEKDRLIPLFEEVQAKALNNSKGIGKKTKLYIVDTMEINAFVIGRNTLALTRGAIETFNDEEIKGIIAHEFGHLSRYDGQITLLLNFCTTMFLWIFIALSFAIRFIEGFFENNIIGSILSFVRFVLDLVVKAVLFVWTIIVSGGSRHAEFMADSYAKTIGYGEQLKQSLYILYDMEISKNKGLIKNLKKSHPILAYRIEELE